MVEKDGVDGSGKFIKGIIPWNKGKRKSFDLVKIHDEHWNKGKSILDIAKELNVSDRLIRLRLKENGYRVRQKDQPSKVTREKISKTMKERGIEPKERYSGEVWNKGLTQEDERVKKNIQGLLENRKYQVMPVKDTKIEVKMQNFLKQLGIEFYTHQYMNIEHGYQCDVLIPEQKGIHKKTIIECFGVYWHNYPYAREIDIQRCSELREKGWRVLVFWENEIKLMHLNNLKEKLIC